MIDSQLIEKYPPTPPVSQLIWTAVVDIGERQDLGAARGGQRFMVPIHGGEFYAGPGIKGLNGKVLPGGADRQLLLSNGVKELDALYEMQTDDGMIITIHNQVIMDESRKPERYALSRIKATVEEGPLEWLNRRLLIGTLQSARPDRQAVIIRAWSVDTCD